MNIDIKVIPGAKRNQIKQDEERLRVYLTAPAVEGKANKALIVFLASHFDVPKRAIHIIKGLKSRLKTIRIED